MTGLAPASQRRSIHRREQLRRQIEPIGAGPVQQVDRRGLRRVIANALRPAGERPGAAIKVDHPLDRGTIASLIRSGIGVRHGPERQIMPVLAHVAQDFRRRRFGNRQAQQRHASSQRDRERGQSAKGMADQMRRAARAPDHRFKRLRLVGNIGVGNTAAFLRAAISKQARGDGTVFVFPLRRHGPPGGAGAA